MSISNPYKTYYDSGSLKSEHWHDENGKSHRTDDPAYIWYYENGNIKTEVWFENNLWHRIDDTAYRYWDENRNLIMEEWWIDGVKLTDQQITVHKRKLKLQQI